MKLNLPPRVVAVCKLIHALTHTQHLVEVDEESVTLKNSAVHLCIILVFFTKRASSMSVFFSGSEEHNVMFSNTEVITNTRSF